MNEDMVLKFCVSYLITTVHLSMNFHEKQIFIGWSLMANGLSVRIRVEVLLK